MFKQFIFTLLFFLVCKPVFAEVLSIECQMWVDKADAVYDEVDVRKNFGAENPVDDARRSLDIDSIDEASFERHFFDQVLNAINGNGSREDISRLAGDLCADRPID